MVEIHRARITKLIVYTHDFDAEKGVEACRFFKSVMEDGNDSGAGVNLDVLSEAVNKAHAALPSVDHAIKTYFERNPEIDDIELEPSSDLDQIGYGCLKLIFAYRHEDGGFKWEDFDSAYETVDAALAEIDAAPKP